MESHHGKDKKQKSIEKKCLSLEEKCLSFAKKARGLKGPEDGLLFTEYLGLIKEISECLNIQELNQIISFIHSDELVESPEDEESIFLNTNNRYSFFSFNQKIFSSLGASIGLIRGIIKNFECLLKDISSVNLHTIYHPSLYGLFFGFLISALIDHIQSISDKYQNMNIYHKLIEKLEMRIEKLQAPMDRTLKL